MTKRHIDPIAGRRLRLRLLAEHDLPMTLAWRNKDHIRKWFIHSDPIMPEQHQRWFAQYSERDDDFVFIVEETKELLKPIGQIALYNIDWERTRAEFGRLMIGEPEAAGKGLAQEAAGLILDYAFSQLNMLEAEVNILSTNVASLTIFLSAGFVEAEEREGVKRLVKLKR